MPKTPTGAKRPADVMGNPYSAESLRELAVHASGARRSRYAAAVAANILRERRPSHQAIANPATA
jgi:hypothetical protein